MTPSKFIHNPFARGMLNGYLVYVFLYFMYNGVKLEHYENAIKTKKKKKNIYIILFSVFIFSIKILIIIN
jgi:hypothetical protein